MMTILKKTQAKIKKKKSASKNDIKALFVKKKKKRFIVIANPTTMNDVETPYIFRFITAYFYLKI